MQEFIESISRGAGKILLEYFGKAKILGAKEYSRDIFTEADVAAQKYIVDAIQKEHPTHHIIAEEGGVEDNSTNHEWVWYVDPLDGTKNFSTQTPLFCTIIGLEHNGSMEYGGIYIPVTDEMYFAQKGHGAYLNGTRIHCSEHTDFNTSVGLGGPSIGHKTRQTREALLANKGADTWMQSIGSAGISAAWTAAGRREWTISLGACDWDYAGCVPILEESGCIVTDRQGNPWKPGERTFVAGNPTMHAFIMESFRKASS